jgi:hypothetical protein
LILGENYAPKFCNFICTAKAGNEGESLFEWFLIISSLPTKVTLKYHENTTASQCSFVLAFHFNNLLETLNLADFLDYQMKHACLKIVDCFRNIFANI